MMHGSLRVHRGAAQTWDVQWREASRQSAAASRSIACLDPQFDTDDTQSKTGRHHANTINS
jgi:hypothetical protein